MRGILVILVFWLCACRSTVDLTAYSYENNTKDGLFDSAPVFDGTAISETKVKVEIWGSVTRTPIAPKHIYIFKTNEKGVLNAQFKTPSSSKDKIYHGLMMTEKEGYKSDTIRFNIRTVDNQVAVFNLEKSTN